MHNRLTFTYVRYVSRSIRSKCYDCCKRSIKERTLSRSSPRLNSDSYRKQEKGGNGIEGIK